MSVTEAPATGLPKLLGNIATALANAEFVSVAAPSAGVVAVTTADGTLSYRVLARQGAANALGLAANVVSCSADSAGCGACASGSSAMMLTIPGSTDTVCLLNAPGVDSAGTECPAGTAKAALGAGSCETCAAGYYATGAGNSVCAPCAAGNYADAAGAESCKACEAAQLPAMASCPASCPATSSVFTLAEDLTGSIPAAYSPPALLSAGCNLDSGALFGVTVATDCSGEWGPCACSCTRTCLLASPGSGNGRRLTPAAPIPASSQ